MKTDIMFRRVLTALAFAAVLALPPAPARAQTNDPAKPQTNAPVRYDLEIENGAVRIPHPGKPDSWEGADLKTIAKLLRDKHPEANIAMAPELADVQVSDLKLHATTVEGELEALRVASGDKFIFRTANYASDVSTLLVTLEPSEKFWKENAPSPKPQVQVEVFNFSSYFAQHQEGGMDDAKFQAFKQQTIDKTKDIIRETLASFGPHGPMNFQFHPGANLLVVTGPQDEISVARKIINAMIEKSSGDLPSFKKTLDDALKKMNSFGAPTP